MATSQSNIATSYTNALTTGTGGTLTDSFSDSASYAFGAGTGANQIDLPWSHSNTLATATDTFTLSALVGPGSATTDLVRVRKIWLHNLATNETGTNTITIAPGATHGWVAAFAGAITIPPGGVLELVAPLATGWPVAVGVTDQVAITSVGTVAYRFCLEGASV